MCLPLEKCPFAKSGPMGEGAAAAVVAAVVEEAVEAAAVEAEEAVLLVGEVVRTHLCHPQPRRRRRR